MLLRLLLALLVASFAVPAAAAGPVCHDEVPMAGMHHDAPEPTGKQAHACVGCVPLADWTAARVTAPVARPMPVAPARVARLDLGGAIAPALPPPRTA